MHNCHTLDTVQSSRMLQGRFFRALIASLLVLASRPSLAADSTHQGKPEAAARTIRFFIDEGYFLEGDTEILRAFIAASEGRMTISGESSAAFLSVKGYYVPDTWDVYWTIRQACHMAYKHMQPHQRVNCIPGVSAMSLKRTFVSTWQQAYGELAFNHIPRSYLLPQQYWLWRSHLLASASPPDTKWVLKANIHRGKGVSVMEQRRAISHALTHKHEPHSSSSSSSSTDEGMHYLNVLVQSYLQQQLVIAGRSNYIRVWLLVTSINPLRAYLFDGGFAIFGKQKGGSTAAAPAGAAPRAAGKKASSNDADELIVNLWLQDRDSSPIWSLQHLREYLDAHPEAVQPLPEPPQQGSATQQQQRQQSRQRSARKPLLQTAVASSSNSSMGNNSSPQRRTFADAWHDMQTSASLVLAAALPAMRAAAAEARAPEQGTFEYFGLDFVLDAHLRPWMLEVNAIPSLARRKKTDCSGETATAQCKLATAAAAAAGRPSTANSSASTAASGDDFDGQKEQFVHDMLVLLGLPVDGPVSSSTASQADAQADAQRTPTDSTQLLRLAAAAAAAAGIRSRAVQPARHNSRNSSHDGGEKAPGTQTDRRLLVKTSTEPCAEMHSRPPLPGAAAAAAATGLHGALTHLQHWHHLQQQQRQHPHAAAAAQRRQFKRHMAAEEAAAGPADKIRAQGSIDASTERSRSSSSAGQQRLGSGDSSGLGNFTGPLLPRPAPTLQQLPAQVRELLCARGSGSASSANGNGSDFGCITCLTAEDLAALAAAEAELQHSGRFVPVHDLLAAHTTNKEALKQAATAAATASSGREGQGSLRRSDAGHNDPAAAAGAMPAGASSGALYLSQSPTVWQKLYKAWKGMSHGGVGVRDLAVMKYYTTASTLSAQKHLGLTRVDYVMSAWLRVRQETACVGVTAVQCTVQRLQLLVRKCYLP